MSARAGEGERMASRAARFTEADVKRAISAAAKSGVRDFKVSLAHDGTISIVVGADARGNITPNSCDDLLS